MLKTRGGAGRYQPARRTVCDRCHGQKLRCERDDKSDSCKRCRKAGAMCLVTPFVRIRRPSVMEPRGIPTREAQAWNPRTGEETGYCTRTPEEEISPSNYLNNETMFWSTVDTDRATFQDNAEHNMALENLLFSPTLTPEAEFGQLQDMNWERRQYQRDDSGCGMSLSPTRQTAILPSGSGSTSSQLDSPRDSMPAERTIQPVDEPSTRQPKDHAETEDEVAIQRLSKLHSSLYSSSTTSSRNGGTGVMNHLPVETLHSYAVALIDVIRSVTALTKQQNIDTPPYDLPKSETSTDQSSNHPTQIKPGTNPSITFLVLGCYSRLLTLFSRTVHHADSALTLLTHSPSNPDREQNSIDLVQMMSSIEYLTIRINNAVYSMTPNQPSIPSTPAALPWDIVCAPMQTICDQKERLHDMIQRVSKSLREGPVV
ncbi:Zn2/Cys6 DNA-binding protein [Glarea lozoyensis ATCC 20868]|uniref:Zn2/Cys6 DNA-binding protein n=1 Tax=Glarea lozoyensis (strain ATCC 20868 / MF5171) TaxID=1116229 RepID=S3CX78_GLAL2|nr:Zn2/Cys6 DNA-binding protein [Glarea lozoyensis ATCC 20868]EPE30952.1 Zn2/Cys6 DNA-binding protein [Glarea lozoyensis ATCC 20868]